MDIVSFETAKKLKDAGFPQPESGFPLIWYGISDFDGADGRTHETNGTVITMLGYMAMPYVVPLSFSEVVELGKGHYKELIFAPTATDILRQMPGVYLCINDANIWRAEWAWTSCYDNTPSIAVGENPAAVAAASWLSLNAKTFEMKIIGDAWKKQL